MIIRQARKQKQKKTFTMFWHTLKYLQAGPSYERADCLGRQGSCEVAAITPNTGLKLCVLSLTLFLSLKDNTNTSPLFEHCLYNVHFGQVFLVLTGEQLICLPTFVSKIAFFHIGYVMKEFPPRHTAILKTGVYAIL